MARSRKNTTPKAEKGRGKFSIIIGDEGAILVFMRGKKVVRRFFAPDSKPENVSSFLELMEANASSPVSVLLDVIDQSYTRHTLPPVSSLGVNKLVQRRLERDFSPDDLKGYITLGREKKGRKDWNFLLISVPQSKLLKGWLDVILELPNHFLGVYLSPIEAQNYIQNIHKALPKLESGVPQWQMLVSHHKVSGYRQVVLKDGKLFFARVAQASNDEPPAVSAGNIEQEIQNTVEYLRRMGLDEEATFELFVVGAQEIIDVFETARFDTVRTEAFTPGTLAQTLKLEQASVSGDQFGDILMTASHITSSKKALKLSIPYADKVNAIALGRTVTRAATVLFFLASVAYIGMNASSILSFSESFGALQNKESQKREELNRVEKIAAELPADAKEISELVAVWNFLKKDEGETFESIKKRILLIKHDDVLIRGFNWKNRSFLTDLNSNEGNQNFNSSRQLEKERKGIEVQVELSFVMDNPTQADFLKRAGEFLGVIRESLPDYEVKYENLFKDSPQEEKSIELNFDDIEDAKAVLDQEKLTAKLILYKEDVATQ